MKGDLNPKLEVGDRIMLFHMEGETSVVPGTFGTVINITRDPFETEDNQIIRVKWDNGSTLSLVTATDVWKKISEKKIEEQRRQRTSLPQYDFFVENSEIFELFDWRFLRKYLKAITDSGIVNMFGASPLLYSGRDHIDRYYGEHPPDEDSFNEVLEMADKAKDKMIIGTLNYMKSKNMEIDIELVNRVISKMANKMLELYMVFSPNDYPS